MNENYLYDDESWPHDLYRDTDGTLELPRFGVPLGLGGTLLTSLAWSNGAWGGSALEPLFALGVGLVCSGISAVMAARMYMATPEVKVQLELAHRTHVDLAFEAEQFLIHEVINNRKIPQLMNGVRRLTDFRMMETMRHALVSQRREELMASLGRAIWLPIALWVVGLGALLGFEFFEQCAESHCLTAPWHGVFVAASQPALAAFFFSGLVICAIWIVAWCRRRGAISQALAPEGKACQLDPIFGHLQRRLEEIGNLGTEEY